VDKQKQKNLKNFHNMEMGIELHDTDLLYIEDDKEKVPEEASISPLIFEQPRNESSLFSLMHPPNELVQPKLAREKNQSLESSSLIQTRMAEGNQSLEASSLSHLLSHYHKLESAAIRNIDLEVN